MIFKEQGMKKVCLRVCSAVLALLLAISASACKKDDDSVSSQVQTVDTASVASQPAVEEQDIGEHKDYDKQTTEGYYSNGVLLVDEDVSLRAMDTFVGDEDSAQFYANELNTMKDRLGAKINVYSMLVPTACEYYCPLNYRGDIDSQKAVVESVGEMLVNVGQVNVWDTLNNHNAEDIYFRTDSRWTPLGAYYAGKVFAKSAGVGYADLSKYTKVESKDFVGNMANYVDYTAAEALKADPEVFTYYKPTNKYKTYYYDENFELLSEGEMFEEVPESMYETFFKGGYYCVKISTDVKNGRKLVVVGDSYITALAPFLTSSYEDVYVVNMDYLEANLVEMITDFQITDLLYVMNTFTATSTRVYQLETLRSQATHGKLQDAAAELDTSTDSSSDSDTDSVTDTDVQSGDGYIYGVGLNNQVGVVESSEPDEGDTVSSEYSDYSETEPSYEDNEVGEDVINDYEVTIDGDEWE